MAAPHLTLVDPESEAATQTGVQPRRFRRATLPQSLRTMAALKTMLSQGRLTPRDQAVVRAVWTFGALRADQIQRLLFPSSGFANPATARRVTNRRLHRLYQHHLLDRTVHSLRAPYIYLLDEVGGRLVQLLTQAEKLRQVWQSKEAAQTLLFLDHRLELAEFALTLAEHVRSLTGARFVWQGERGLRLLKRDGAHLRPDGAGTLHLTGHPPLTFLVEWDRGRETLPEIGQKVRHYLLCRAYPPGWQTHFDTFPPLVFITTGGPGRCDHMQHQAEHQLAHFGRPDYPILLATAADLTTFGILAPVFRPAGQRTDPVSLLGSANPQLPSTLTPEAHP